MSLQRTTIPVKSSRYVDYYAALSSHTCFEDSLAHIEGSKRVNLENRFEAVTGKFGCGG